VIDLPLFISLYAKLLTIISHLDSLVGWFGGVHQFEATRVRETRVKGSHGGGSGGGGRRGLRVRSLKEFREQR
jgi:hypothetical protein